MEKGRILGNRFKVLYTLDMGSQGTVYQGEDIKIGEEVAIKVFNRHKTF